MKNDNDLLIAELNRYFGSTDIILPSGIYFSLQNNTCTITLGKTKVLNNNMQNDECAFEGWALAVYEMLLRNGSCQEAKIKLDITNPLPSYFNDGSLQNTYNSGHLCRFLYRALRFSEQYPWFELSDSLCSTVNAFRSYLYSENLTFTNNTPSNDAKSDPEGEKEHAIEAWFSRGNHLRDAVKTHEFDFSENKIFRQLPVGLFFGEKAHRGTHVFTGGSSAIDLWTWQNNTFIPIELKTENKMVGIVTEIFFYSNYMRDLLLDGGRFKLNPGNKKTHRGYDVLREKSAAFTNITGIMLADQFHPTQTKKLLELMNENSDTPIRYYRLSYDYEEQLNALRKEREH